jgi:16S rRNA (cytosine967-C5)-methyltransferase
VTGRSSRAVAIDALVRVEDGAFSHLLLPSLLRRSGLAARDRAFVTDLVYATLRAERRLDDLLGRVSARPVEALDPPVRAALRLGALQLLRGVAPHAAVAETVAAVPARGRGYVNATLRSLTRLGPPWPEPPTEAVALSYPDWLVERLRADLGVDDARALLLAGNERGAVTLRPNPARADAAGVEGELVGAGATVTRGRLVAGALVVRGAGDPASLAPVAEGRATPQDQGSQAVVEYLAPQPGDRVLDVAAAPGGKATAIAELVGAAGLVVAADVHPGRLGLVATAARRLGLDRLRTLVADARHVPVRSGAFDRALVDAPCSGLGVLSRRPESRWRISADALPRLARLQRAMILEAAPAVRPGGTLVYAVCTVTAAETADVAQHVIAALPDWTVLPPPPAPWRPSGGGGLLLPQVAGTDGMFVLGLRRHAG